tara:strand:+ start:4010 stop:4285 length:276 start_codon:yes stop_codon:yes gene_type:complete
MLEEHTVLIADIAEIPIAIKRGALLAELPLVVNTLPVNVNIAENLRIVMPLPLDTNNVVAWVMKLVVKKLCLTVLRHPLLLRQVRSLAANR